MRRLEEIKRNAHNFNWRGRVTLNIRSIYFGLIPKIVSFYHQTNVSVCLSVCLSVFFCMSVCWNGVKWSWKLIATISSNFFLSYHHLQLWNWNIKKMLLCKWYLVWWRHQQPINCLLSLTTPSGCHWLLREWLKVSVCLCYVCLFVCRYLCVYGWLSASEWGSVCVCLMSVCLCVGIFVSLSVSVYVSIGIFAPMRHYERYWTNFTFYECVGIITLGMDCPG